MAWSLVTLEKWVSSMVTVPVRATWPHPQNRATPEKQRIVATSDAYGTPPKHLMQHSKQPVRKKMRNVPLKCFCFYRKKLWKAMPAEQNPASKCTKWASLVQKFFIPIFITVTFHWDFHKPTLAVVNKPIEVITVLQKVMAFLFSLQFGLRLLVQHCIKGHRWAFSRLGGVCQ